MTRPKTKPTPNTNTKTCPRCRASLASVLHLCECGYHFQTARKVPMRRDDESPDSAILRREEDSALRYGWLARSVTLFVVLAYVSLVARSLSA